ncbi:Putative multidrug resistance protein MdtD [Streptomyces narbonensis]
MPMYGARQVCDHHIHAADRLRHERHQHALHPPHAPPVAGRPDRLRRPVPGRPRRLRRERRTAVHADRPRSLRVRAAVGDQRVLDRLRRLHAARRPGRRPLRAEGDIPARARALHRRVRRRRHRAGGPVPDRRPRRAGPRRRPPLARHAHPRHRGRRGRTARTRAIGTWTAVGAAGGAAGGFVGGLLVDLLSWRWVLLINVPIGVLVLAAAALWLREGRTGTGNRHLDLPGAVLVTGGLATLAYGIVQTEEAGWTPTRPPCSRSSAASSSSRSSSPSRRARRPR